MLYNISTIHMMIKQYDFHLIISMCFLYTLPYLLVGGYILPHNSLVGLTHTLLNYHYNYALIYCFSHFLFIFYPLSPKTT